MIGENIAMEWENDHGLLERLWKCEQNFKYQYKLIG